MGDNLLKKMPCFSRNAKVVVFSLYAFLIFAGFFWAVKSNSEKVGRYQFFVKDDHLCVYIFDTKTSRLFLRNTINIKTKQLLRRGSAEGKTVCLDLGTVHQPLIPYIDEPITEWWEKDKIVSPRKPIRLSDLPSEAVQP